MSNKNYCSCMTQSEAVMYNIIQEQKDKIAELEELNKDKMFEITKLRAERYELKLKTKQQHELKKKGARTPS